MDSPFQHDRPLDVALHELSGTLATVKKQSGGQSICHKRFVSLARTQYVTSVQVLHRFIAFSRPGAGGRPHLLHLAEGSSSSNSDAVGDIVSGKRSGQGTPKVNVVLARESVLIYIFGINVRHAVHGLMSSESRSFRPGDSRQFAKEREHGEV